MDVEREAGTVPVLFKSAKRKRVYRERMPDENNEKISELTTSITAPPDAIRDGGLTDQDQEFSTGHPPDEDTSSTLAQLLQQRKAGRKKRVGIEFTQATLPVASQSLTMIESPEDDVPEDLRSVVSRFAPQTGQVTDETDKHMMAFIESEMAKRSLPKESPTRDSNDDEEEYSADEDLLDQGIRRNPASVGKLHEIDLGVDATLRNIARTEAAISGEGDKDDRLARAKPPKPRVGRNGKIYIPRPRKRRNSADIARDKIVEELMRETKLDIYDDGAEDEPADGREGDAEQEADDRIAEQFRREFLDAISQRKMKSRAAPVNGVASAKKGEERPKGPKLGGSRSARAAMREREEAAAKASKKR